MVDAIPRDPVILAGSGREEGEQPLAAQYLDRVLVPQAGKTGQRWHGQRLRRDCERRQQRKPQLAPLGIIMTF